ncbi:DUF3821 domain-containing protein [Methanoculleus sp. Wushi-C6]|uniref:DUF3821 domain-containing protein n=1 Tax=Methanoculleus caldifontis TaxID=2651577 RepID=A0ABU3X0F0_9EURY|nr:MEMAR_RS02690 family S-layer glycoprotein [Methanoculleus sp. Wushi-C6]MDV2481528.1 DUF3821 domain-containing protein [Methanoculleus sp. Wushi-C6]
MKSMTKLMVVAMLLVAALVVAPVAAQRTVGNGDTIYVGEDNLDLSALYAGTSGHLVYYSNIASATAGTVGRTISVTNTSDFDLTASAVGSSTGTWYAFNAPPFTDPSAAVGTVLAETPSTNLRVLLGNTGTTSVDGQSVTRSSAIRFRVDHNLAGLGVGTADPNYNTIEVRLTTPGGGTVTQFGNPAQSLRLQLTGQWTETAPINLTGATAGTYTARGVWPTAAGLGTEYNTNAVTFQVSSGAVGITSNKDTVVRGNAFTVTITGESEQDYFLTLQNPGAQPPTFRANQVGVTVNTATNATVRTTAAGTRSVELLTTTATREASYTVRVTDPRDASRYDEVRVRVETGSVTITASGTGTFYVGEEITLSGTNTDSDTVYLFMTGPNLGTRGVNLLGTLNPVVNGTATSFVNVDVEADDTWSYRWDTSGITRSLDSGGYTVYAVSAPRDRDNLANVEYATRTVQLRPGFITATMSSATVAKGDDVTITGTAQGNPSNVNIWVFGKNYYGGANGALAVQTVSVESDGTFDYDILNTENLVAGQYFVVVQHPMGANFEVAQGTLAGQSPNSIYRADETGATNVFVANLVTLQASEAANALINALESPFVNDAYTKLTFFLEDAWIRINPVGDQAAGSTFTISGTTNLAAGEQLIVEVTSAAFQPGTAGQATGFSSDAGSVTIQQGETANTWSFEVDATAFRPDQYIVTVESIEAGTTTTGSFNVIQGQPTPTPTTPGAVTPTATPGEVTPTATPTATPTQSPGFGALVALAGLGAVAFLVLRRN